MTALLWALIAAAAVDRPASDVLALAWREQAHRILASSWETSPLATHETRLLCGGPRELAANAEGGALACLVWPAGTGAGAVVIPYLCCPAFFPCSEPRLAGACAVAPPVTDL